jgi:hypothetical protein
MPKETVSEPNKGGLVRLKFTFKYGDKFVEPDDDWLKSIEAVSDELLGPYSKAEDTALSAAFGGRKKKRLNRVFDAIGFVYPDYRYPTRGQKRKDTASTKEVASAALGEPAPKRNKIKVLTHRSRYIEPTTVPEFVGESSSAPEAKEATPLKNIEESVTMPEIKKIEEPKAEETRTSEILSPSAKVEVLKSQKGPALTPKRKRMVNVLDVLETISLQALLRRKLPKLPKCKSKPLRPKLQSTKLKLKLGLQSPPR